MQLPEHLKPIDVAVACGVTSVTVMKWVKRGLLPKPVRISYHVCLWKREEIEPYLESLSRR